MRHIRAVVWGGATPVESVFGPRGARDGGGEYKGANAWNKFKRDEQVVRV